MGGRGSAGNLFFAQSTHKRPLRAAPRTLNTIFAAGAHDEGIDPDEGIDTGILGQGGLRGKTSRKRIEAHHDIFCANQNNFTADINGSR